MLEKIIREMLHSDRVLPTITLEITSACNLKCVHCYLEDRKEPHTVNCLMLSDIKSITKDLKELKVLSVMLTGGEPMMHPEFYDIIKFLNEENFIVNMMSNITMININNIKIIEQYVNSITTTLYGFSDDTYNAVTRSKDGYQRYCRAKDLLLSSSIRLTERGILLKENKEDLMNYINCNMNTEMHISHTINTNYAAQHRIDKKMSICYYCEWMKRNNANIDDSSEDAPIYVCNSCVDSLFIKANGDIYACANLDIGFGNIRSTSLKEIVFSGMLNKKRELFKYENFKKCYNCDHVKYNPVICPGNNQEETGCMFTPSKYSCELCHSVYAAYNMFLSDKKNK